LSGFFTSTGGSGFPGWSFGGEINISDNSMGFTFMTGPSAGVPLELHGFGEGGMVVPISEVISPSIIADYWSGVFSGLWDSLFGDGKKGSDG
jgi:hypothetical protein